MPAARKKFRDGSSRLSGVHLLARTTRRGNLTEDGAAFLDRCRRILADLEEAEMVLRRTRVTPTGRLLIDMPADAPLVAGALEPVLVSFEPAADPISLVYSPTRHLSPKVRVFVDFIAAQLR
jgi:DNA-binding transcriptional LysR family regulator